jgi:hypothetical protein
MNIGAPAWRTERQPASWGAPAEPAKSGADPNHGLSPKTRGGVVSPDLHKGQSN